MLGNLEEPVAWELVEKCAKVSATAIISRFEKP